MALLCLHLRHGVQALFQSLGWVRHNSRALIDRGAAIAAIAIFAGNCSIPVAILLGYARDMVQ
jgi:succinate dehydrogenase / fumarate reductase cytochrome b subunit